MASTRRGREGRAENFWLNALVYDAVYSIPSLRLKYNNLRFNSLGPEFVRRASLEELGFGDDRQAPTLEDGVDLENLPERMALNDKIVGLLLGPNKAPTQTNRTVLPAGHRIDEATVDRAADIVHREKDLFLATFRVKPNSPCHAFGDDRDGKIALMNHFLLLWGFAFVGPADAGVRRVCCSVAGVGLTEIYIRASCLDDAASTAIYERVVEAHRIRDGDGLISRCESLKI